MRRFVGTRRAAGGWGIAFVVLLLVSSALASLPTAADSAAAIAAFYRDHASIVVVQQVVGVVALVPLVLFGISLPPNRWLKPALFLLVGVELVTQIVPLLILASPGSAQALTSVEDLADAVLFVTVALFVLAATLGQPRWMRVGAYVVAAACLLRAVGVSVFALAAPLLFLALILIMCVWMLVKGRQIPAAQPGG
ncbi:MAG: hypothetical protein E6I72_08635 [Chloroflexi bacterium]|nr:MAG: hypothetical protein E6I72_08635 [Chloroflexota bacterium]